MHSALVRLVCLVIALAAFGCQQPHNSIQHADNNLPPEFARILSNYETAWRTKDAHSLASLFAEDGFVLQNGGPHVRGRAAIEGLYTGAGGPLFLRAFAWGRCDNVGYIIGGYRPKLDQEDSGKFTLTLKRNETGRWLIMSDMDNSNSRPKRP